MNFPYRAINWLRKAVWTRPSLYRPLGRLRRNLDVWDTDYDVTVEGYPRSANTFFAGLLELTQPHLRVRSHRHIPAFAIAAAKVKLPVVLLIRRPVDCITSFAIMHQTSVAPQLFYYIAYFESLRAYKHDFLVANFEDVTEDPKKVLRRMAQRFPMKINLDFDFAEANREVLQRIDSLSRSKAGVIHPRIVHRPTEARQSWKADLKSEVMRPDLRHWLDYANVIYEEFRRRADADDQTVSAPTPIPSARRSKPEEQRTSSR